MSGLVRVAVDAMGGDNAPFVNVKGAVDAVKECDSLKVFLVGKKDVVEISPKLHAFFPSRLPPNP